MSLDADMLANIRKGLDHHNATCPMPAKAILLNPGNHELFGWDELWGIPVLPDERVAPRRFRIQCDASSFGIEDKIAEWAEQPAPAQPAEPLVVPGTPGRPGEPHARR